MSRFNFGFGFGFGPPDPVKGDGSIFDFTVIFSGRVIGPQTRFVDTRA